MTAPLPDYIFRKALRDTAWTEQDSKCRYCRNPLKRHEVTADHEKARIRGGTDRGNIVAACYACNQAKDRMSPAAFMKLLKSWDWRGFDIEMIRIRRRLNLAVERACRNIRRYAR